MRILFAGQSCNNPACLYLHTMGADEDSFGKDEVVAVHTRNRVQKIVGATKYPPRRCGIMLPPPIVEQSNSYNTSTDDPVRNDGQKSVALGDHLPCSKDMDAAVRSSKESTTFKDIVGRSSNLVEEERMLNLSHDDHVDTKSLGSVLSKNSEISDDQKSKDSAESSHASSFSSAESKDPAKPSHTASFIYAQSKDPADTTKDYNYNSWWHTDYHNQSSYVDKEDIVQAVFVNFELNDRYNEKKFQSLAKSDRIYTGSNSFSNEEIIQPDERYTFRGFTKLGSLKVHQGLGAPFLILCLERDDLAPYPVVYTFSQQVQGLGGHVRLFGWKDSPHVKLQQLAERTGMEGMHDKICKLVCDLQNAAIDLNQSLRRVAVGPNDHFFLPSLAEYQSNKESGSLQDKQKERRAVLLASPPSLNPHSILGMHGYFRNSNQVPLYQLAKRIQHEKQRLLSNPYSLWSKKDAPSIGPTDYVSMPSIVSQANNHELVEGTAISSYEPQEVYGAMRNFAAEVADDGEESDIEFKDGPPAFGVNAGPSSGAPSAISSLNRQAHESYLQVSFIKSKYNLTHLIQIVNSQVSRSTLLRTMGSSRFTTNEPDPSRVRITDASPGALKGSSLAQRRSRVIFSDQIQPVSRNSSSSNLKNFESTLKSIESMRL
ncbi:putative alpha/beta hydrolase [Tanacetum coccineum]